MTARRLGTLGAALTLLVSSLCVSRVPAGAAISASDRHVLEAYLDSIERERYASALALLAANDRRYFGSATHFASMFTADGFSLAGYRIVGSQTTSLGTVALVSERMSFRDDAHDARARATADVFRTVSFDPRAVRRSTIPVIRGVHRARRTSAPQWVAYACAYARSRSLRAASRWC